MSATFGPVMRVDLSLKPPPLSARGGHQIKTANCITRCSKSASARTHTSARPSPSSVQSRSLITAGLHRSHFNVVVWKLISKMQACLQSINEPSMLRFLIVRKWPKDAQ